MPTNNRSTSCKLGENPAYHVRFVGEAHDEYSNCIDDAEGVATWRLPILTM